MVRNEKGSVGKRRRSLNFHVLIFCVGLLITVTLWDVYLNGTTPFDREITSVVVLIAGTFFSVTAGVFSWSLQSHHDLLERQVEQRTQELNQRNRELESQNKEIENFIHIISHDLKAPIVSIRGFASLLHNELGESLQGVTADYFERIVANVKQMNELIVDLLEFSRVGRMEDEKECVDLKELMKGVVEELRPELEKRHIQVRVAEHLPELVGSRKRLNQVFMNLVGNAVKYMGSPPEPAIEIGCAEPKAKEGLVTIWVKDTGVGIKKEFQDRIFQIFQRAPNSLNVEGSGIGLSIVKKIVELNGGTVSVQSEEGRGSQFFVQWPKANHHPDASGVPGPDSSIRRSIQEDHETQRYG